MRNGGGGGVSRAAPHLTRLNFFFLRVVQNRACTGVSEHWRRRAARHGGFRFPILWITGKHDLPKGTVLGLEPTPTAKVAAATPLRAALA